MARRGASTGSERSDETGINVFFATNRDRLGPAFDTAAPLDPTRLTLGRVQVEVVGDALKTEAKRDLVGLPDSTGDDNFADPAKGSCAKVLDKWLAAAAVPDGVALLYIHGFSCGFGFAASRLGQITEFYRGADVCIAPLLFSWPSDGEMIFKTERRSLIGGALAQYQLDQADAVAAGRALARLLSAIRDARQRRSGQQPRTFLLAHSMGGLALSSGLHALDNGLMTQDMREIFDHSALVAVDVATDVFSPRQPMRRIADLSKRVTVGISVDSVLSAISTKFNECSRLGHSGPDQLEAIPENVDVVDYYEGLSGDTERRVRAFGVTTWDVVTHQWYRNDTNARADLALAMLGKPFTHRKVLKKSHQVQTSRSRTMALLPYPVE